MNSVRIISDAKSASLAHLYRMNMKPRREQPTVIQRTVKKIPEIHVDVADEVQNIRYTLNHSLHTSVTDDLDTDEEDSYYFDSQSPRASGDERDHMVKAYEAACKKYESIVMSSVKANLQKETFACKFVQLQRNDSKAICSALMDNRHVKKIEFEQNCFETKSVEYVGQVVEGNVFLTHLTLVDNELKSDGAKIICESVQFNEMIEYLDLSGNGFVESDGAIFKTLLNHSTSLRELYLGRNNLMDIGVKEIASAIEDSAILRVLDLQWNHVRLGGAVAIGEALEENRSLQVINLAWNGLHMDGARAIADALKKNDTLKEMDLTCNRLTERCVAELLLGLDKNETLEILRLGQNHITCKGSESILRHVANNKSSGIKLLDFGNQEVKDTFIEVYKQLHEERGVVVTHGIVWNTRRKSLTASTEDDDEVLLLSCNPLTVLMECMRLQNFRLIDFFKSLDTNKSNLICINELCSGMLKVGIPIRRFMLLKLLHKLDKDNNKMLDYSEMIEAQNMHRLNLRRALAAANSQFDLTDIGRVSAILRRVMAKGVVMKKQESDTRLSNAKRETRSRSPSPYNIDSVETRMGLERPSSNMSSSSKAQRSPNGSKNASRVPSASNKDTANKKHAKVNNLKVTGSGGGRVSSESAGKSPGNSRSSSASSGRSHTSSSSRSSNSKK